MPKTVIENKGLTVISVAADKKSMFPSLCQILKALCYSPECCSASQGPMKTTVTTALGVRGIKMYHIQLVTGGSDNKIVLNLLQTIQIMVGLFNIGLGPGRTSTNPGDLTSLGAAYWLGAVVK